MKRNKVLLGFILAAFMGSFGFADAQTNANYQNASMVEIGPDNIGGRARALVAVRGDNGDAVLYAGGVAGGLYKRKNVSGSWEYIPYYDNGTEVTLPISDMVAASNNKIYIATGEGYYKHAVNNEPFAPQGHGVFEYDMTSNTITAIASTDPRTNGAFSYINRLAYMNRDGKAYLYIGTTKGLFLMTANSGEALGAPVKVCDGAVQDIELLPALNICFFTMGSKIYKIGNVKERSTEESLMTNSAITFGDSAARIELAAAYSNNRIYLYAVVTDAAGLLNGVFLTHDQQNWTRLTSSTVSPFTSSTNGWTNNSIAIDPFNHNRIFVGGATLWVGQGYTEGSYYLWNKISNSETELNAGNYMSTVYFSSQFLHSGINAIVPVIVDTANYSVNYYYATDGGIYVDYGTHIMSSLNNGFNTVQFNNIAVAPDGSLIGGAVNNAVPFVQSRMNHDGGVVNNSWYDQNSRLNHMAIVLWQGSGSDVAATMFQQVSPQGRRGIFVSSQNGQFGRSYADYNDFTNTQTWTRGSYFTTNLVSGSEHQPKMLLWETTNNTKWNDSVEFTIDTLGTYVSGNEVKPLRGNTVIRSGDKVTVPSPAHFDYPIEYTFTKSFTVKDQMTHKIHNPIANRMFIVSKASNGNPQVLMTCSPSDFHKVYDDAFGESTWMRWYTIFQAVSDQYHDTLAIRQIAVSNDCNVLFIGLEEPSSGKTRIYRVSNLSSADVNNPAIATQQLGFQNEFVVGKRITVLDTIFRADGSYEYNRPITSMTTDKRNGKDVLVITFGGYASDNSANMVVVENATTKSYNVREVKCSNSGQNFSANDPVYSALIDCTKGNVFIGTEKGVFKADAITGNPSWSKYGDFRGVPVTSIVQQTAALPSVSYVQHSGINPVNYCFAKTKYPYAIYFGTYGRGIFMDTSYVVDHENEIVDSSYWTGITNVTKGKNSVRVYPNPAENEANVEITMVNDASVVVRVFDITGRLVFSDKLGRLNAGINNYQLDCSKLQHGMYLVNVVSGSQAAASKLIVK